MIFLQKLKSFFLYIFLLILIVFSSSNKIIADESNNNLLWTTSAGSYFSERFFAGSQITSNNIKDLDKFWTFKSGSTSKFNSVQAPPIFIGNQLILTTLAGELMSISPENGKLLWEKKLETPLGRRGLTYHKSTEKNIDGIYVSSGKNIIQLNKNGEIKNKFLTGISLLQPILSKKTLYVATLREGIKAYDLITKKEIWNTSLYKNKINSRVWSGFSFDEESNFLFVVTSNPSDVIGENRSGEDFSVSLIAIDADDGKIKWQYKHIVNDVWDFDLVGNPIIVKNLNTTSHEIPIDCVIALSKTGDVIMVDINTGLPVFEDSYRDVQVQKSDMENVYSSPTQKFYLKPEKFSDIVIDKDKDFNHLEEDNLNYIKNRLRHAKSGFYIPTSVNHDVILYGLHGGAQWPGATLYRDDKSTNLIIPSNNDPWIIRVNYQEKKYLDIVESVGNSSFNKVYQKLVSVKNYFKNFLAPSTAEHGYNLPARVYTKEYMHSNSVDTSFRNRTEINGSFSKTEKRYKIADLIYKFTPGSSNNALYKQKCSSCHGIARQGRYETERVGDNFYPSLVGITKTNKWSLTDTYTKVLKIHEENNIDLDLSADQYNSIMEYFDKFDENLFKKNLIEKEGFWQILLDKKGLPATKPPWGKITNINLLNGKKVWEIPFGRRKINDNKYIYGDVNFGGVLSTKSKIIFANGTTNPLAYAYNIDDGEKIWESSLPYSGSAPPMAFRYKGCDIIVFTATGGKFVGYKKNGDSTVAYKLTSCEFN